MANLYLGNLNGTSSLHDLFAFDGFDIALATVRTSGRIEVTAGIGSVLVLTGDFSSLDQSEWEIFSIAVTQDGVSVVSVSDITLSVTQFETLSGTELAQTLLAGNDVVSSVLDWDLVISTYAGNDMVSLGDGQNTIFTGAGNDTVLGGDGQDSLVGGGGNDRLLGNIGNDRLLGGDGNDTLNGGGGNDFISGGESAADLRDVIFGGAGHDSIDGGYGNDLIYGQDGNDTIAGGFGADELQGQGGDDAITGSAYADLIFGGAGNDFINGGFGHDLINGGAGADKFYHLGVEGHGSDWVQDYNAAEGDVLLFGNASATADDFQVNLAHTASAAGERAGDDDMAEAFVIYTPTGQIMWALVDGAGQDEINLQINGDVFDLLA